MSQKNLDTFRRMSQKNGVRKPGDNTLTSYDNIKKGGPPPMVDIASAGDRNKAQSDNVPG